MDKETSKRLHDILIAISEIEDFCTRLGRRFDIFSNDLLFLRAVQMNIAIIGEAIGKILETHPDIKITSARKIKDTRNYVIHGYDSLSPEILWSVVIKHLPTLKNEVRALIAPS